MATAKVRKENLERSESNRVLAGVCGGLGAFFGIDSTIIRWSFVLFTLFGGSGVLLYLILWLFIPSPSGVLVDKKHLKEGVDKVKAYAEKHDASQTLGLIILVIGILFLLDNLGWLQLFYLNRLWPLFLVGLGVFMLSKK